MPAISKELFYEKVTDDTSCNVIHYWEKDCLKKNFSWYFIKNLILGSGKFFLPVYILKLALNYKKAKDKKYLLSLILSEARSIIYGIAMGEMIVATMCFNRAILGRLHYYPILFIPGAISGLSVLIESKENQILDALIFFNSLVETVLNKLQLSVKMETFAFMLVSGALMSILENRKKDIKFMYLWFYTPQRIQQADDKQNRSCIHKESCFEYVYKGFGKYFALGYAVNIVRSVLPRMGRMVQKPSLLVRLLLNKSNFLFGLLIGSYTGLYKLISCYLNKTSVVKKEFRGLISGFLSGAAYAIYPSVQVFVIAITTLLQDLPTALTDNGDEVLKRFISLSVKVVTLIYDHIAITLKITDSFWQRQLLFMFCHGYLLHNKMFFSETCSPYYSKMIDACTNNLSYHMYRKLLKEYFGIVV